MQKETGTSKKGSSSPKLREGQEALQDWLNVPAGPRKLDLNYAPPQAFSLPKPIASFLFKVLKLKDLIPVFDDISPIDPARTPAENAKFFSDKGLANMGIGIKVDGIPLDQIPKEGPLIVVSNHPFGGPEGMALMSVLLPFRPDLKILINTVLGIFPDLRPCSLPLDILSGKASSVARNIASMRWAQNHLDNGGALSFFPSGTVSHWQRGKGVVDPEWQTTVARFAQRSNAPVLPVFFHGKNSFMFNLLGLLHPMLRTMLLPREMLAKKGTDMHLTIGRTIDPATLNLLGTAEARTAYMRMRSYALADIPPTGLAPAQPPRPMEPVAAPHAPEVVTKAFACLPDDTLLLREGNYAIYSVRGGQSPLLLEELGSLREATFRLVGEGSGKARDIDMYDDKYHHLLLWNEKDKVLVGAYRLGKVQEILAEHGPSGLYTTSLFRMSDEFFRRYCNALELGRAVVHPQYQREYVPLMLLWKGIGRFLLRHDEIHCLFGPVSLSLDYAPASLRTAVDYLREQCGSAELANLVRGRKLPDKLLSFSAEIPLPDSINYNGLVALVRDIEGGRGIPILFKHYLKLGGKIGAFHLDTAFNTLDAFLLMDLVHSPKNMLQRYMTPEGAETFLARWGEGAGSDETDEAQDADG